MRMFKKGCDRYGPYPKEKERKKDRPKEGPLLKRSYDWLKWKMEKIGGFYIHHPCLEH